VDEIYFGINILFMLIGAWIWLHPRSNVSEDSGDALMGPLLIGVGGMGLICGAILKVLFSA